MLILTTASRFEALLSASWIRDAAMLFLPGTFLASSRPPTKDPETIENDVQNINHFGTLFMNVQSNFGPECGPKKLPKIIEI